ncbi:MAG: sulfotransferase family 2 domain-containing protein [Planctomycetota bacterium]|jgi:hypothetical protein
MTDPLIIFVHIPKTGGTSLKNMVKDHLGDAVQWDATDKGTIGGNTIQVMMGHFPYGGHERYPDREVKYFTMLRDPIQRLWSHYWSVVRNPGHYQHFKAVFLGHARYFADRSLTYENDNTQTRMLCGQGFGWDAREPITQADYEQAKRNLATFAAVGIFEHYEESVKKIYRALHWKKDPLRFDNRGRGKPDVIPDEALVVMRDVTVFDRQLYEVGKEIFSHG